MTSTKIYDATPADTFVAKLKEKHGIKEECRKPSLKTRYVVVAGETLYSDHKWDGEPTTKKRAEKRAAQLVKEGKDAYVDAVQIWA